MSTADDIPRPAGSDDQQLADELDRVRVERDEMRVERDELRELLGLSPALRDAHRNTTTVTLLDDNAREPGTDVDMYSAPALKVALFADLFQGRKDVYAERWTNTQTGKSGYAPAVRRGANGREPGNSKDARGLLPMTPQVIEHHLRGSIVAGIYPMLADGTCRLIACDFDGDGWALDALAYLNACAAISVPTALERSRSGNGAHVWIFFEEPVNAVTARKLAMQLLRTAMDERCELDLASYDRLFPSQDHMPKGGYGNLIALPLQPAARARCNSEFLDPSTLQPWPDQWEFLAQVKRIGGSAIDQLIRYLPPIDIGPESAMRMRRRANEPAAPETVTCTLSSELSIERSGLPPSLVTSLKHSATVHNPVWHQRTKLRLSTHNVPRFVRCYREDLAHLHLPRGLQDRTREMIKQAGSSVELIDARAVCPNVELAFGLGLSDGQQAALVALERHDYGTLVAPPGAGKTRIACALIARRSVPTLVVAHTRPLLDQWRAALGDALGLASKQIGQFGGGRKHRTHIVDLATLQSLTRVDDLGEFLNGYGMLIVDECHHTPAVSFEQVVNRSSARFVLGLTATPVRRDGMQDIITMQCGPIRHRMSTSDAKRDDGPVLELVVKRRATSFECDHDELDRPIQQHFAALAADSERTALVCDDIVAASAHGRRSIVLSQWKRHCVAISQALIEHGIEPILLHGDLGKRERGRLLDKVVGTPMDENLVVVATAQLLGEGFDCPQLDTLFLPFPIAFKGRLVQYTGRLMRPHSGKASVHVYDYRDDAIPVLAAMGAKRAAAFRSLGFRAD